MSMPTFPTISPEITREKALNMILASIAMEELGLSHIINAEGEKIQYVLKQLSENTSHGTCIEDILAVNKSVESLMNVLMQNQIFLKNKMESVLDIIDSEIGPIGPTGCTGPTGDSGPAGPTGEMGKRGPRGSRGFQGKKGLPGPTGCTGPVGPPGCSSKCVGAFHEGCSEYLWKLNTPYPWECSFICGDSIQIDSCACSEIWLKPDRYYSISFDMNIVALPCNMRKSMMINLITSSLEENKNWFTYYFLPSSLQQVFTMSTGNIMIHTLGCNERIGLALYLEYPAAVKCGRCSLSIVEL